LAATLVDASYQKQITIHHFARLELESFDGAVLEL